MKLFGIGRQESEAKHRIKKEKVLESTMKTIVISMVCFIGLNVLSDILKG